MKFGEMLKSLRIEQRYTQQELADILNLSKSNISKYESNSIEPNLDTIQKIADFFKVSTDYLLGRSIIRNPETQGKTIAAHQDGELTEEEKEELNDFVDFLYSKRNKK